MVFTFLHYPQAYILYRYFRNNLSYPGLLLGSFLPDLEVPVLVMLGYGVDHARLVLHSFIGSLLFSWIIGLFALPIYKYFLRRILGLNARIDLFKYIISIEIGSIIHVFIDAMHHVYNPLLWPLTTANVSVLIPFGKQEEMHTLLHILFLVLTITCIIEIFRNIDKTNAKTILESLLEKTLYDPFNNP